MDRGRVNSVLEVLGGRWHCSERLPKSPSLLALAWEIWTMVVVADQGAPRSITVAGHQSILSFSQLNA